jgi:hypothetical protein
MAKGKDIRISREHSSKNYGVHRDVSERRSDESGWTKTDHIPSDEQSIPVRVETDTGGKK